jgi:hypothetical protein
MLWVRPQALVGWFFSTKIPIRNRREDGWVYDPVFDDDYIDEALREADRVDLLTSMLMARPILPRPLCQA